MDIFSIAKANNALAQANKLLINRNNFNLPNKYEKFKILDKTDDHTTWTYDAVNSTATGAMTTETVIDTSTGAFPTSLYDRETLTPDLFSKNGAMPGLGNSMVKATATSVGSAIFHKAVTAFSLANAGEIDFSCWTDVYSQDTDALVYVKIRLYTDYANSKTKYWTSSQYSQVYHDKGRGAWKHFCNPGIRATGYWTAVGGAGAISSINGIGIEVISATAGKTATVYLSGIFNVQNSLSKGTILIDFDDNYQSHYTEAFSYMYGKYGYKGNISCCGKFVTTGSSSDGLGGTLPSITTTQMLEMDNAGWDMTSHTWDHDNWLVTYAYAMGAQESIRANAEWLRSLGLYRSSRFIIYPGGGYRAWHAKIAKQCGHVLGRSTGAIHLQILPCLNPFGFASDQMDDTLTEANWRYNLNEVATKKLMTLHQFHNIGDSGYGKTSVANFKMMIDCIKDYDVQVLSWSDLYDNYIQPL